MKKVKGNLLDMFDNGDFDIIVHGCNCHHDMSGGIAAQIADRYPEVLERDIHTLYGAEQKLGSISIVHLNSPVIQGCAIVNAYTQFFPGPDARLGAVREAFKTIAMLAKLSHWPSMKIGIPAIGCGIGGLSMDYIEPMLDRICKGIDITLVEYQP